MINMQKPQYKYMVMIRCFTYNHGRYLEDALRGFVNQKTNFPFVAVVIDDFSSDDTADVLQEYENRYPDIIKAIYLTENYYSKGKSKYPLYKDINESSKYVALCEGDDYWTDPLKLQKQVDFMESNQEYSMCFHNAKVVNDVGTRTYFSEGAVEDRDYSSNDIFPKWIVPTASVLYKREPVDGVIISYREWLMYGDIGLFLSCAKVGKLRGFSDEMSVYRINSGGVTQRCANDLYRRWALHERCLRLNFPDLDRKRLNRSIAGYYYSLSKNDAGFILKCSDFLFAFLNSPCYVINKVRNAVCRRFNNNSK